MAKMQAMLIGPESELGDVRKGLVVFGNHIFPEKWTDIDVTADEAEKLKSNRYVQLKGVDVAPDDKAAKDDVVAAAKDEAKVSTDAPKPAQK